MYEDNHNESLVFESQGESEIEVCTSAQPNPRAATVCTDSVAANVTERNY